MKKKFHILALCSFSLALFLFLVTYILFHHLSPTGFTAVPQTVPGKPFITMLFGIWGVLFLFAGCMSLLIGRIFFKEK